MRKSPLGGLSWPQLIAGALAAMTSAWVASYLGVAGTIIGAAVGSLVASIASAMYARGIDRGTTLITESGSVITRSRPADASGAEDEEVVVADGEVLTIEEPDRAFPWKRTLVWAGAALATALLLIGGYELATGSAFGKADNPSIGRPWTGGGDSGSDRRDAPADETEPTAEPTDDSPRTPAPTTPAPTTAPTPAPDTAPTVEPSPEASPDAPQAPLDGGE